MHKANQKAHPFVPSKPTRIPEEISQKVDLSAILAEMPPFVARNHPRFKEWTGYSGRTMANLDSLKQTTSIKKILLGNTVAYENKGLVRWMEDRVILIDEGR